MAAGDPRHCHNKSRGAILKHGDDCEGGFNRLSETLASLVAQAEQLSLCRCPYRNRYEECTAQFGCVNQRKEFTSAGLPLCLSDGLLNHHRA